MRTLALFTAILSASLVASPAPADPRRPAAGSESVVLDNAVSACLSVSITRTLTQQNLVLGEANVALSRSTADCGCKSALLSYRSLERRGARSERLLAKGTFVSFSFGAQPTSFLFVLQPDARYKPKGSLVLAIGCDLPE